MSRIFKINLGIAILLPCLSLVLAAPAHAGNLTFEKAISGDAFEASGRVIALYGVESPAPSDPNAFAATLYLDTLLVRGPLDCRRVPGSPRMTCTANGADVGSQIVQMGMGGSVGPVYATEKADAQRHRRGIWRGRGIK